MRQVSGAAACNTMRAQEDCNLPWDSNDDMNDCMNDGTKRDKLLVRQMI